MADRPMIFSAPMVRALLAGTKTQTRRVLKPWPGAQAKWLSMKTLHRAPTCYLCEANGHLGVQMQHPLAGTVQDYGPVDAMSPLTWVRLPYAPGDRLWVRETWRSQSMRPDDVIYRADGESLMPWRSPIHMPRWASRITLTVTDVRVQRVAEIDEYDAKSEGAEAVLVSRGWNLDGHGFGSVSYVAGFQSLWNSIHGPGAWDANPWVVALTFVREA
jgi:hypothetical protein